MPRKNCPYKNLAPLRGASRPEEQAVLQNPKFVTEEQNVLVNEGDNIRSLSTLQQYLTRTSSSNHQNYSCQRGRQPQVFVNSIEHQQHHQTDKTILVF